jgi:hypothetical protein
MKGKLRRHKSNNESSNPNKSDSIYAYKDNLRWHKKIWNPTYKLNVMVSGAGRASPGTEKQSWDTFSHL